MTFWPENGLHWTAEENWTKHSFSFLKFIIFVDLERKNEFHGSIAIYKLYNNENILIIVRNIDNVPYADLFIQ